MHAAVNIDSNVLSDTLDSILRCARLILVESSAISRYFRFALNGFSDQLRWSQSVIFENIVVELVSAIVHCMSCKLSWWYRSAIVDLE